jgi:HEAT repeat protein
MKELGDTTEDVSGFVAHLVEALKSRDAPSTITAARQLGELGRRAEAALPALIEALQDDEEHTLYVFWDDQATTPVRLAVAEALLKISPAGIEAAIPVLIELLAHHDAYDPNYDSTRPAAITLLTSIGAAAVPALREAIRSKNQEVRALAQEVLRLVQLRDGDSQGGK